MQQIVSKVRSAVDEYKMINQNERIAAAVSGGKDSMLMLAALKKLSHFHPASFSVFAVFVDMGFENVDLTALYDFCNQLEVELVVAKTDISKIIFEYRKEKNPCALCAKMRRAVLHDTAKQNGSNKIALGHHMDDAVVTFLLNLIYGSKLSCFQPVTYLDRKDVTVIRPMLLLSEREITGAVNRLDIPVVKSACPADSNTKRTELAQLAKTLEKSYPGFKKRVFGAIRRSGIDGW